MFAYAEQPQAYVGDGGVDEQQFKSGFVAEQAVQPHCRTHDRPGASTHTRGTRRSCTGRLWAMPNTNRPRIGP